MGKIWKIIALAIVVVMFIAGFWIHDKLSRAKGDGSREVEFVIKPGAGSVFVINNLYGARLITSRTLFRLLLRLTGNEGSIKRGVYALNDAMSPMEIIKTITSGKSKVKVVTIPEGYHNRQIGDLLTQKGFFASRQEFLNYASNADLLKKYNIPATTTEGYLYPETYHIPIDYGPVRIIELFIDTFFEKVPNLEGIDMQPDALHSLVILASIVEREAQQKEERPIISGVFHNRLSQNYPLESCATVQYLFEKPKKRLLYKDLEIKSPYNTYLHKGLPPAPIANPGLAAIRAALHPVKTTYKYFVLKDDGTHYFSETFREHEQAKDKYSQIRSN